MKHPNLVEKHLDLQRLRNLVWENDKELKSTRQSRRKLRQFSTEEEEIPSPPILIQLSIHPDEEYSFQSMISLLQSTPSISLNIPDDFCCDVLMYTIRY